MLICALAQALGLVLIGVALTLFTLTALSVHLNQESLEGYTGFVFSTVVMAGAAFCAYLVATPPCG